MTQDECSNGPAGYFSNLEPPDDSFSAGFTAMFRGTGFLMRSPKCWPYAAVPLVVVIVFSGVFGWAVVHWVQPWAEGLFGPAGDTAWWSSALSWLATVIAITAGLFLAYVLASPLSAPALEKLVESREGELGAPGRVARGFLWELSAGFRATIAALAFTAPLWILIWIIELAIPAVAPLTLLAKVLITAAAVSWTLLDYPLTLRGIPLRQRLRLWRRRPGLVAGFGVAFAALFWIPCFGLLMLPVGVVAATEVSWRLLLAQWDETGKAPPSVVASATAERLPEAPRS